MEATLAHKSEVKSSNWQPPTHPQVRRHGSQSSCNGCGACRKITSSTNAAASLMLKSLDHGKKICATSFLQRSYGNQYVQRLIQTKKDAPCLERRGSRTIQMKASGCCGGCANGKEEEGIPMQTKLTIGRPGDKYEQEADRVADTVMRMSEPQVQRQPEEEEEEELQMKSLSEQITPIVQRQPMEEEEEELQMKSLSDQITPLVQRQPEEEEEEELIQARDVSGSTPGVTPDMETNLNTLRGGGQPLPEAAKSFMETRFGSDFSGVRVHTTGDAVQMNRELNAEAFTHGRDIYFGAGRYSPTTPVGKKLLAHELTHVVQQRGESSFRQKLTIGQPGGMLERKANKNKGLTSSKIPDIQCGFFGDLWEGAKDVGRTIGRGASAAWKWAKGVGRTIGRGAKSAWEWTKGVGRTIGRGAKSAWEWTKGVGRTIGKGAEAAWGWIKGVGRAIGRGAKAAWGWIKSIGRTIGRGAKAAWEWIKDVGRAIGRGAKAAWGWIKSIGRAIGRGAKAAWEWLKKAGRVVWGCLKGFFGGASAKAVQPKLRINQPRNVHEEEADRVADQVMRVEHPGTKEANPLISRSSINVKHNLSSPSIQRYAEDIHYYKTLEDAVNVGFGPIDAGTVAYEDQAVDTGWRHPWVSTPREFVNPRVSGKDMLHFPARGVAIGDLKQAIGSCDIKAFGAGLHRFQDTFSHNFTTWSIPVRRLCASLCWKISPLHAAAILLPNPAYGRGAVLKHACLGFYPDEHHSEQKGRDASMRRGTRSWLRKFLSSCKSGGKCGPGTAVGATGGPTTGGPPGPSLSVDKIDIIDSSSGAIGGYPPITSGDLNSPGPYNNPTTGGVNNVHQIHFRLDNGDSADLIPQRKLQRSAFIAGVEHKNPPDQPLPPGHAGPPAPGGFDGVIIGPDGPGAHEIKRPSSCKIVIADAPGIASLHSSHYPFIYKSHFHLTVAERGGNDIARIKYDVKIEKKNAADVPNTKNSVIAREKEDLVRNRSLP